MECDLSMQQPTTREERQQLQFENVSKEENKKPAMLSYAKKLRQRYGTKSKSGSSAPAQQPKCPAWNSPPSILNTPSPMQTFLLFPAPTKPTGLNQPPLQQNSPSPKITSPSLPKKCPSTRPALLKLA
jgi:hypothetical protein